MSNNKYLKIAILGGGPSALFIYKRFIELSRQEIEIDIFEKGDRLGAGMPYSTSGSGVEHITNVSGNEIPDIVKPIAEWIHTVPQDTLDKYGINPEEFNEFRTLPRLLFGDYLRDQFAMLQRSAKEKGISTRVFYGSMVTDIRDDVSAEQVHVEINGREEYSYDRVVICTGHLWPRKYEGQIPGYFDSPYPPAKLALQSAHPIAVRGSSLTAIDAIRTLARSNGYFERDEQGRASFVNQTPGFRIVMHSRNGLLPALRFHLEDPHLGKQTVLSPEEIASVRSENEGFLPLDYVFEKNFRAGIHENDPEFYEKIKDLSLEQFVALVMDLREKLDPFVLLDAEYTEAERSIKRRESIYWKEMLGVLSFAMNYPAKYFSAEDMIRLQQVLMPLIAVVIAYVPQNSAQELLAMHRAGCLEIVAVGEDSEVLPQTDGGIIYRYSDVDGVTKEEYFHIFVDCIGQPHLSFEELPYPSLIEHKTVSRAKIYFREAAAAKKELENGNPKVFMDHSNNYYLLVPGISINDSFQAVDDFNALNERIYVMAVPFIGGYNPDYSGLDFGEAASAVIAKALLS